MKRRLTVALGSFLGTGFFPVAPATFASAVFLALYRLPGGEALVSPAVVLVTLILSVPVSSAMEKRYGHDARCIVIDEVVGLQAMLLGAHPTLRGVVAVFFLFRILDVVKPFPIRRSQRLPGGWGVVADDFLAGAAGRLLLWAASVLVPGWGIGGFGF
jgi:phosphatidylglycerophosphatase A